MGMGDDEEPAFGRRKRTHAASALNGNRAPA